MVIGIIIDFVVTFLACFIIYKCINTLQRPSLKTIFKSVGLGLLAITISLVLNTLFDLLIGKGLDGLFEKLMDILPITGFISRLIDLFFREVLIFVIIEEVAKYFLFNYLWNNGNLNLKSPLQTALIFVVVGATFSFLEDVTYILRGTAPYVRILSTISGHLTYALIYSHFFSKEVVRSKAMYKMDEYLTLLKQPVGTPNRYRTNQKYLFKGFLLSVAVHFGHNLLATLLMNVNIIGTIIVWTEVLVLTVFFIIKLRKMIRVDVSYDTLVERKIFTDFPKLKDILIRINKLD